MQPNVTVEPRLQECGIHHAFFQNNKNRETQEKDLSYLATRMSYEDVMLRARPAILSLEGRDHGQSKDGRAEG